MLTKYIGDLFIRQRLFVTAGSLIVLLVLSFFIPSIFVFVLLLVILVILACLTDYILLFSGRSPQVRRIMADRLSNGDDNTITLKVKNRMTMPVRMEIIDELPFQFQQRDFKLVRNYKKRQERTLNYILRPSSRGEYYFGQTRIYVSSKVGLLSRRFISETAESVPVYPSFISIRKYQLLARTTLLHEHGSKRLRKIGSSMEFEQIKDYVIGDDVRNVNWKATARKGALMINNYIDEKSQQVYCVIDKGRLMKMPFNKLTLLDHAINSTLVLANISLTKEDKVGLITFSDKIGGVVPADRKMVQREHILQMLYKEQTHFFESDFEMLYLQIRQKIKQRSLIILYTNFESLSGLNRQLNYLRSIARHHLLLVVFFENTELARLTKAEAITLEDVYVKTIAEKFAFEKRLIVKELQKHGILSILTSPADLTVNTVNKYLELKARQAI